MNYKDMAVINERKLKAELEEQKRISYIAFLLGIDNFYISHKIRDLNEEFAVPIELFEDCTYIAKKFLEYDKKYFNTMSEYDSLAYFLKEYENEIVEYLENRTNFEIKKGE